MPIELQKAMDNTLSNIPDVICFLDDILIVTKGSASDHNLIVNNVFEKPYEEGFSKKKDLMAGFRHRSLRL